MKNKTSSQLFGFTVVLAILLLLVNAGTSLSDTLELTDGTMVEGKYMGGTQNSFRFQVGDHTYTYAVTDVLALTIDSSTAAAGAPTQQQTQQVSAPAAAAVTVPAGTFVLVRMTQAVDSSRHKAGHRFTAQLEADLVANNQVAAKRGSNVYGRLTESKQAGRVAGKSEMTLELTGIMVNNQIKPVVTSEVKAVSAQGSGRSTVRRTAVAAGVGAAFGGSKGARRGAAVGAGVSVLSQGSTINIPADTLLEYRLAAPFTP